MVTVNDVLNYLDSVAPVATKMDFDNVGFLVGRGGDALSAVIVSLDITSAVISEATETGAGLIVSHHPLFFTLKSVTDTDTTGSRIVQMLSNGISGICMHTNLDAALGGVNDSLADAISLTGAQKPLELLSNDGEYEGRAYSCGRIGYLNEPLTLAEFLPSVKAALNTDVLRYHDAGSKVQKIALVSGSGGDQLSHVIRQGCDTFVTADVKYDVFLEAKELGINLIDADHYCTENVVTAPLAERLQAAFPEIRVSVSTVHTKTVKTYY